MAYKVQLLYFRPTGKFLSATETTIEIDGLAEIWEAIDDMRRLGILPGLRPGTGRDLFVVVDVPDHPRRVLHMVTAPFLDEDDVTPLRAPTDEMIPLVRVPLEALPRTSTRDVLPKIAEAPDEEITPVDRPIPEMPDKK